MSKTETTSTTPTPVKKTYTYFNLETFVQESVEKEISFNPAKTTAEALDRINNDDSLLLKALNAFLQRQAFSAVRREVAALGGSRKIVFSVIKPFRSMAPFNTIYKLDATGAPVVENGEKVVDRPEQTKQLLNMIKLNPAMVEAIKNASQAEAENDEDDDEKNNDE